MKFREKIFALAGTHLVLHPITSTHSNIFSWIFLINFFPILTFTEITVNPQHKIRLCCNHKRNMNKTIWSGKLVNSATEYFFPNRADTPTLYSNDPKQTKAMINFYERAWSVGCCVMLLTCLFTITLSQQQRRNERLKENLRRAFWTGIIPRESHVTR